MRSEQISARLLNLPPGPRTFLRWEGPAKNEIRRKRGREGTRKSENGKGNEQEGKTECDKTRGMRERDGEEVAVLFGSEIRASRNCVESNLEEVSS